MWGCFIFILSLLFVCIELYALIWSKLSPPSEDQQQQQHIAASTTSDWMEWMMLARLAIAEDRYYCLLIPLSIPVTLLAVYLNWVGLKLFRHNPR